MAAGKPNDAAARERLEAVLAAYGADPARWPDSDRELASGLATGLATDHPTLSAPLEEARAMDRVLARASHPVPPPGAGERLISRAAERPRAVVSPARRGRARPRSHRAEVPGRVAALLALAASLALGLYLGASGQGGWLVSPLLAEDTEAYLAAELDVLDATVQLFEDHMEP